LKVEISPEPKESGKNSQSRTDREVDFTEALISLQTQEAPVLWEMSKNVASGLIQT